ncbi:hypothetical protein MN033_12080 [Bacillus nitratireducens]|uniref:hypothetical protein n=1 Tax=Bacillus nitratireducens TaxID=2026193 RepID=UPI001F5775D4|nr:hypothetical protein [Bacillus nitratireducens]UNP78821.1 hypothetical protein MN033_12080 [Bacillus nitratireducens]
MKNRFIPTVKLTSFNGTTLTGVTTEGIGLAANVTASTIFHQANLSHFPPQEPHRPLVVAYNAAVRSGRRAAILNAVTALANAGASAQIRLGPCDNTLVASFRPVPSII